MIKDNIWQIYGLDTEFSGGTNSRRVLITFMDSDADGIPDDQLQNLFVHPIRTPEEGVERVLSKHGADAKIAAIPEGPYVLAKIAKQP